MTDPGINLRLGHHSTLARVALGALVLFVEGQHLPEGPRCAPVVAGLCLGNSVSNTECYVQIEHTAKTMALAIIQQMPTGPRLIGRREAQPPPFGRPGVLNVRIVDGLVRASYAGMELEFSPPSLAPVSLQVHGDTATSEGVVFESMYIDRL